ncbi:retropepsin-like aspartic protease family protein [Methylolobus aquaticus]
MPPVPPRPASGRSRRRYPLLPVVVWCLMVAVPAPAAELGTVLEALSRRHQFALQGLENLAPGDAVDGLPTGDLSGQIRQLLQRYNYLLVSAEAHRIEKVVIIGAKPEAPAAESAPAVTLRRDGVHHRVDASLTGPNGRVIDTTLIIDTGASNLVLPSSMIEALGFRAQDLADARSQTASGSVPVKLATLPAVAVGAKLAQDVAVSFVEDRRLGDLRLLGMSFLSRFTVTIDDRNRRLILVDR